MGNVKITAEVDGQESPNTVDLKATEDGYLLVQMAPTESEEYSEYIDTIQVNTGTTFAQRHNFPYTFESGGRYEIEVSYMFNANVTNADFITQLLIGDIPIGQVDDEGNTYFHREELTDSGSGGDTAIPGTGSNQQHSFYSRIEYVAPTSGDMNVVYQWAISSGTSESSIWRSTIKIKRLS